MPNIFEILAMRKKTRRKNHKNRTDSNIHAIVSMHNTVSPSIVLMHRRLYTYLVIFVNFSLWYRLRCVVTLNVANLLQFLSGRWRNKKCRKRLGVSQSNDLVYSIIGHLIVSSKQKPHIIIRLFFTVISQEKSISSIIQFDLGQFV